MQTVAHDLRPILATTTHPLMGVDVEAQLVGHAIVEPPSRDGDAER